MDIVKIIKDELQIKTEQVEAVIKLIDEGDTIPFIARYRKEVTGALDDETLRKFDERLTYLRNLSDRKETVLKSIEEQGKLTDELRKQIDDALTLVAVEDLYRPYKQKKRTRAMIAKEKGLEPLADIIYINNTKESLSNLALAYVNEEKGVANANEAIEGAKDIIAERISDEADYRTYIRNITVKEGTIVTSTKDPENKTVYEMYYDYSSAVAKIPSHAVLAINRGENEKVLSVKVVAPVDKIIAHLEKTIIRRENGETTEALRAAIADAYDRLIAPAIEREIRNDLTEKAEDGAIKVFGKNLTQLLMQPPIAGRTVLGWDPGYAHGCKLAVVDATGKVLDTVVVYPTKPREEIDKTKKIVSALIKKHNVTLISCGNGTASRESEIIIADMIKEYNLKDVDYIITNEAGASVYSASKLAAEEFPDYDVNQRSAVSIARRIQDPLAELVKIDPKSIGVGQYQHDMNQKKLSETLSGVVEDCVNNVGVDVNTASASLLEYVSGISKVIAKNIVAYREENGRFKNRKEFLKVAKLGPKAFEQCAGFLRIVGGTNPLDSTSVHPESYEAAEKLLSMMGLTSKDVTVAGVSGLSDKAKNTKALSEEMGVGEFTLKDIIKELEKPGRDPREDMPKPILRSDVLEIKDLKPGMILKGTVRNVIDFGAFVDIGVHQDGLVHISQLKKGMFVKHPLDILKVGDIVDVKVLSADETKMRIQLSMILD